MSIPVSVQAAPRGGLVAVALLLVYVVWGSTYLGIHLALEGGVPPLTVISGARFVVAGGVLYALLRWRGVAAPTRAQWKTLVVMGLSLLLLGNGMVVLAERDVSSGLAAVAVASVPLWMALFSAIRGEKVSGGEWLGIAVGFAGVQMLCGGVILVVAGLLRGERMTALPSTQGLLAVAYLCVFGSIVAFTAYVWLLHNVRPVLTSSYAYVNPVIAVALGAWIAHERFSLADIGAMAVILAGVVVITLARMRRA